MKLADYKCNKCGKIVKRKSDKAWLKSFCVFKTANARLYRVRQRK